MKKVKITTPENIDIEVVLAEALSRCCAAMIDLIIQILVGIIVGWAFLAILDQLMIIGSDRYYGWLVGSLIIIEAIIVYGYYVICEMVMSGRTIGKKVLHLRTIKNNGGTISVKDVILRNLFRVFIDNFGIGILMMFFQKKNKRIGDLVAGTMVIIEEKNERPIPLEEMVSVRDEVKQYLTKEEYNLLREYFERKRTMSYYEPLREEMKEYFKERFQEAGIYQENQDFINAI